MTQTPRFAFTLAPVLAVLACYNTSSVENGGLVCGNGSTCPDGFTCHADNRCWKTGGGAVCAAPFGPFAGCSEGGTTANSTCDPVCQANCQCGHRCVLTSDASRFVCEATTSVTSFVAPLGTCGTPNEDRCAPGSVCIGDDVCPNLCYKTCRADQDCPASAYCTKTAVNPVGGSALDGVNLCSPPSESCNPTGTAACGTPKSGFNCVLVAGLMATHTTDATVCDCATLHSEKIGAACVDAPDNCQPGAVCMAGTCRALCGLSGAAPACSSGARCTPVFGSSRYGYCP
jgi:hypothetical protein